MAIAITACRTFHIKTNHHTFTVISPGMTTVSPPPVSLNYMRNSVHKLQKSRDACLDFRGLLTRALKKDSHGTETDTDQMLPHAGRATLRSPARSEAGVVVYLLTN